MTPARRHLPAIRDAEMGAASFIPHLTESDLRHQSRFSRSITPEFPPNADILPT